MTVKKMFNVLIASPGDIIVERKIVSEICSGINEGVLPNSAGLSFKITKWEDIFSLKMSTQDVIKKLTEDYDIFICIFYRKICSFPDKGASESLKEFLSSYESWSSMKKPHGMFFFKTMKEPSHQDSDDPELIKVLDLKEKIKNNAHFIHEEFSAPYEFCAKVHDHIEKWADENTKA